MSRPFTIFAARFHGWWATVLCLIVGGVLLLSWVAVAVSSGDDSKRGGRLGRTVWLLVGCGIMLLTTLYLQFDKIDGSQVSISWPWYAPIGGFMAFVFAYLLGEDQEAPAETPAEAVSA